MAAPGTSSSLASVWKVSWTLALSSPRRVADPALPPVAVPLVEVAPAGGAVEDAGGAVDDTGACVGVDVHAVNANAAAVAMPHAMRRRDGICRLLLGLLLVTVDSPATLMTALNLPQRRRQIYPQRPHEMANNATVRSGWANSQTRVQLAPMDRLAATAASHPSRLRCSPVPIVCRPVRRKPFTLCSIGNEVNRLRSPGGCTIGLLRL